MRMRMRIPSDLNYKMRRTIFNQIGLPATKRRAFRDHFTIGSQKSPAVQKYN